MASRVFDVRAPREQCGHTFFFSGRLAQSETPRFVSRVHVEPSRREPQSYALGAQPAHDQNAAAPHALKSARGGL